MLPKIEDSKERWRALPFGPPYTYKRPLKVDEYWNFYVFVFGFNFGLIFGLWTKHDRN